MHIIYVNGDDWVGLYANGKLVMEGHEIQPMELLEWLVGSGQTIAKVESVEPDMDWLADRGSFPNDYADVVL
ncbi:hypothetical protein KEU06_08835 [Pseudaminobacter sp. 19-2017]|uniref:Uncharacterized protein n=1 Tax=Pseudaminobacter soli (ex Zhang et al. 2022) TaxID=2831468 RepID=A0A942DX15_9HYPH|nr:hypothetical protein [Pseudaminobacter soli]MBS3648733.1 hypothetical protein [Pseudaminobacter soli]